MALFSAPRDRPSAVHPLGHLCLALSPLTQLLQKTCKMSQGPGTRTGAHSASGRGLGALHGGVCCPPCCPAPLQSVSERSPLCPAPSLGPACQHWAPVCWQPVAARMSCFISEAALAGNGNPEATPQGDRHKQEALETDRAGQGVDPVHPRDSLALRSGAAWPLALEVSGVRGSLWLRPPGRLEGRQAQLCAGPGAPPGCQPLAPLDSMKWNQQLGRRPCGRSLALGLLPWAPCSRRSGPAARLGDTPLPSCTPLGPQDKTQLVVLHPVFHQKEGA